MIKLDDTSDNYFCPFCQSSVPKIFDTYRTKECYFNMDLQFHFVTNEKNNTNVFELQMFNCPTCKNVSFYAKGKKNLLGHDISLYPTSLAKKFPEYIPKYIRDDYEEAYSILYLSPKASATLSRRCLQGMIRNFYGITKKTLYDEISALKDKVSTSQWKALNGLRSIGNIGAHMEKDVNVIIDVEPNEAEKLIKLIEYLIKEWYIAKHEEEELYNEIVDISEEKKNKRSTK